MADGPELTPKDLADAIRLLTGIGNSCVLITVALVTILDDISPGFRTRVLDLFRAVVPDWPPTERAIGKFLISNLESLPPPRDTGSRN